MVDGAKRDRCVWPGDMGVGLPSAFVSNGDMESFNNSLQTMYDHQNSDGSFPYAGPPFLLPPFSDTYHMWTMIGTYNYFLFTNDAGFLNRNWEKYLKAMGYIYGKVRPPGLLNVTGSADWARANSGGNTSESQMILYNTLITGARLATWLGDKTGLADKWMAQAVALRNATMKYCYDQTYGAFRDNCTDTKVYPQDGNTLAILFGMVDPGSLEAQSISKRLTANWNEFGAVPPELPGNISPFASSFEVQAHLIAGQPLRAFDLMHRSWGWYLNHPNGTGSTTMEGYKFDGTFYYLWNGLYGHSSGTSHSHGWGTGPTSALSNYVLGLSVTGPAGRTWLFAPQMGNLTKVEGGFRTKLGKFQASWEKKGQGYKASWSTPDGTQGDVVLPGLMEGIKPRIRLNDKIVEVGGNYDVLTNTIKFRMMGGSHTIVINYFYIMGVYKNFTSV